MFLLGLCFARISFFGCFITDLSVYLHLFLILLTYFFYPWFNSFSYVLIKFAFGLNLLDCIWIICSLLFHIYFYCHYFCSCFYQFNLILINLFVFWFVCQCFNLLSCILMNLLFDLTYLCFHIFDRVCLNLDELLLISSFLSSNLIDLLF